MTIEDREYADQLYEALLPFEGRAAMIASIDVYGPVDRALGALEGLMHRWEDAERHMEAAVALDRQMGARPALVQTWLEYARMLKRRAWPGDASRADELVEHALREGAALGMVDLAMVVENFGLSRSAPPAPSAMPDPPRADAGEVAVVRREGDVWSVERAGRTFSVRDSKGMQQLARLVLARCEVHALELAGGSGSSREQATTAASSGSAAPALDERAKREYRRRVEELQAEIDDADHCADLGRASKAREELQFLLDELSAAVGLGGRDRPTSSNAERARVAVTKTIKSAIDRISEHDRELGDHLRSAVSTGVFCSYRPDPTAAMRVEIA